MRKSATGHAFPL